MPSKPAFPKPVATLPGEADVLANVLSDLSDHDAKLVYADWLEEHDDKRGPLLRNVVTAYRAGKKPPKVKSEWKLWSELLGFTVVSELRETVLEESADEVLALVQPAITYKTPKATEKSIAVGASKFGGRPDLPANTKWPKFKGQSLSFLGQFNLAELQPSPIARPLPATGVLSAFCLYRGDGDDFFPKGSWRLFYFPDPSKLVRTELDDELGEGSRFPSCRVEYSEAPTLPHPSSDAAADLQLEDSHPADDIYVELYFNTSPGDHILGYSYPIQPGLSEKKGERHLLAIGGNGQTGWEFGDGGELYFMLDEKQMKAGQFDRVKMFMECG